MAGNIYGPDQIRRINTLYPALVAHVRELLQADHTGVGLMRVHAQVESFDSDEMARIFRELTFISPREKLALVRAAIYELLAKEPALFISPVVDTTAASAEVRNAAVDAAKVFTPPQFKLNVNKSETFHGQKPADTPPPAPVVTSTVPQKTYTPKSSDQLREGAKQEAAQKAKLDAAVAKLRADSAPKPIEIPDVPADAFIGIDLASEDSDRTVVAEVDEDGSVTSVEE